MFKLLKENPFFRFLVLGTLIYLTWYLAYEFYIKPHSSLDRWVIDHIVSGTESFLKLLGYSLIEYPQSNFMNRVGIKGSLGVTVGAPCDGIILFGLFATFILAYPGPVKHKIWYAPLGIFLIHLINILRVAALAIIVDINPDWLAFNHDYTFTILVYGFVFLLWYIWIAKFGTKQVKKANALSHE